MNRHIKVIFWFLIGHVAAFAWARLILGRFRDAVLSDFQPPSGSGAFFNSFSSDPGGYRGRYVPGA